MKQRCKWVTGDCLYIDYHDFEWGVPVYDDQQLFEFLVLETFQAGLIWITILKKREFFRLAFENFDYKKIATYTQKEIDILKEDKNIVRNKLKIKATITNAQNFIKIQEEFGSFSVYIWRFVDGIPIKNQFNTPDQVPANTLLSDAISKDLKKRGFKFVGSTVIYAYMQAIGMVNDHTKDCFKYNEV